jgi:hypothetical protein
MNGKFSFSCEGSQTVVPFTLARGKQAANLASRSSIKKCCAGFESGTSLENAIDWEDCELFPVFAVKLFFLF